MATLREEKKMKKYLALALLIFAAPTIASTKFPAGDYVSMDGKQKLSINADGEYELRFPWGRETLTKRGLAILSHGCTYHGNKGNLWVINENGGETCYVTRMAGERLVIQAFTAAEIDGIWVKANSP